MAFRFVYQYPEGVVNPEFSVFKITEGYQFVFFKENGTVNNRISIDSKTIKNNTVTLYVGNVAKAIELFRDFLNKK